VALETYNIGEVFALSEGGEFAGLSSCSGKGPFDKEAFSGSEEREGEVKVVGYAHRDEGEVNVGIGCEVGDVAVCFGSLGEAVIVDRGLCG
jgi:hypothetical protein